MDGFKQGAQTGGLRSHGERMGFKYGGAVKDTSSEFVQKSGKQDDMDTGTQPARKGRSQREIEAGGTPKLKPEFKTGGRAKGTTKAKKGGKMKKEYAEGGLAAAKKVMDQHVKAPAPKGHGVKSGMKKGGYNSSPMYGK